MSEPTQLKISALTPKELAHVLAKASNRAITEEQVREVAEAGNLISHDGTIHLIKFAAFLAREVTHGTD